MKTVSLIGRRGDLDQVAFRNYYEESHAPLAIKHLPFRRYVRNHVTRRTADLPRFDVLPEFEFEDLQAIQKILASRTGEIIRADEAQFMGSVRFSAATETIDVVNATAGVHRTTIFLQRLSAGRDDAAERSDVLDWARTFTADSTRATIERISPFAGAAFPADYLVNFWTADDPSHGTPPGFTRVGDASFAVFETSQSQLTQWSVS